MSTRYFTNAAIALLAGLIVVLSVGLTSVTAVAWVAFGTALGVIVISALAQLDRHRGIAQRGLDAVMVAIAGTLAGVSIVYGGTVVKWLDFALALGLAAVAFGGMTLHEVENWRRARELGELHWLAPEYAPPRPRREEVPHSTASIR